MTVAIYVAVGVLAVVVAWLMFEVRAVRNKVALVPDDGNILSLLRALDQRSKANETSIELLATRVGEVEGRLPFAISYVGVVAYNAFGNITGNQSRSVALLSQRGDGLVITLLASREETIFYTKEVRSARGVEELSPEEATAVDRALGG